MTTQKVSYSLFVCGITAAILCFSVIVVTYVFRIKVVPATAYYILAIPPAWFYLRSEYNRLKKQTYELSRDAAMVLLSVFLGFYLVPHLLQFLAFSNYSPGVAHYHHYALLALIASTLLTRLHAYGGKAFCVFAGTVTGLIAFFFILTAIPVLSPGYYPISTAFAAFFLSLLLSATARDDGLIRTTLVRFANVTDELWNSLKQFFFWFLLLACSILFAISLFHPVNRKLTGIQLAALLAGDTPLPPSRGDLSEILLPQSNFFIGISLIVLAVVLAFFYFERTPQQEKYQRFSPLLWFALALLLVYSSCLSYVFYTFPDTLFRLNLQIVVWAVVSFIAGRFLNLSPLWLWGIFLLYPFFLPSIEGQTRNFVVFHPLTLACVAIILAVLSIVIRRFKILYEHTYPWPWAHNTFLEPSFFFSTASQVVVYLVFFQAVAHTSYRHAWPTVIGMFLAALPALAITHSLRTSRHFLFYLPYTFACIGLMFALQSNFPRNGWLIHLKNEHLINCGLLATLVTAVISEYLLACKETAYRLLKDIAAIGIVLLTLFVYLSSRNIDSISWQRLLTSGIVTLGAGLYFMRLMHQEGSRKEELQGLSIRKD